MFAAVLAAIAAFEQVFLRENDVALFGFVEVVGIQLIMAIKGSIHVTHAAKVAIFLDFRE